ncbi:MAG: 50S ribosomal protein L4 [Bacteroidota bacterium]
MKIKVLNIEGKETGREVNLSDDIFAIDPNNHSVYLSVKQFLANQRQGTHKSKERSEISGSTRKLHKQKGTGGSRKGDINSPLFRGGARVFGPKPRDYSFKLNKKEKNLAKKSAFSIKVKENNLIVLEDPNFDAPKTKNFIAVLNNLGIKKDKATLILGENNYNVYLASRNIPNANVSLADKVNIYDIMNANKIIVAESAIKALEANMSN